MDLLSNKIDESQIEEDIDKYFDCVFSGSRENFIKCVSSALISGLKEKYDFRNEKVLKDFERKLGDEIDLYYNIVKYFADMIIVDKAIELNDQKEVSEILSRYVVVGLKYYELESGRLLCRAILEGYKRALISSFQSLEDSLRELNETLEELKKNK